MDSLKKFKKPILLIFMLLTFLSAPGISNENLDPEAEEFTNPTPPARKVKHQKVTLPSEKFKKNRIKNKAEHIPGTTARVLPEVTTKIFISNRDINRFTCEGGRPVKDVIYSEEKGLAHEKKNDDAFLKLLVARDGYGKLKYKKDPVEIYVLCGSEATTYSLIGIPADIPAQHIKLAAPNEKIKKNVSLFQGMPFEKKISLIMKQAYLADFPDSYTLKEKDDDISINIKGIAAKLKMVVRIEGEGLQVKIFNLMLKKQIDNEFINVTEKLFLSQVYSKKPVAITLESQKIKSGRVTRLFVIEQLEENQS